MSEQSNGDDLPAVTARSAKRAGRGLTVFAALTAAALGTGFLVVNEKKSSQQDTLAREAEHAADAPPLVEVTTVRRSPASRSLTLPGTVAAWYQSSIYARVDGFVGDWSADMGDHVKKGQVLATIETPDNDSKLAAANARLKADQAIVEARKSDVDFNASQLKRWNESPKGVVSDQEREAKKAAYDTSVARLNEAQSQVAHDQAEVERFAQFVEFKKVTAPYDGIVTERRIDIGNLITAGSTTNMMPLYRLVQDDPARVFVDVPQSVAADIKVGASAEVRIGASSQSKKGTVARTSNEFDGKTRTLRVEVDLPNPDRTLVHGMFVDVSLALPTEGLFEVPAAALAFNSKGTFVGVVDSNHRVRFRKVTIVKDHGEFVDLGDEVTEGEQIALNINSGIADGDVVEVHEPGTGKSALP